MIAFVGKTINFTYNSIPNEAISAFDKNSSYIAGSIRKYGNNKYIALADIPQTVNHIWDNLDTLNTYGYDLYTDAKIADPTAVPITNNVTLVYVKSTKHYYKATATTTVNYATMNWSSPTNFTDLGANPSPLYRTSLSYPDGKKDTLLWGYYGVLNEVAMIDEVLNIQSINDRSFTHSGSVTFSGNTCTLATALPTNFYVNDKIKISGSSNNNSVFKIATIAGNRLSFTIDTTFTTETHSNIVFYTQTYVKFSNMGINRVAIFNTECDSIELKITVGTTTQTISSIMLDTEWINTFELFCFNEPTKLFKTVFEFEPNYNQDFELSFFGTTQKIGEIIVGTTVDLGKVLDTVDMNSKVYATITEAENGDIYLTEEITQNDVLERKTFEMLVDSDKTLSYFNRIKELLGKKVVLSGSDVDNDNYRFLLTYGFIREQASKPRVREEQTVYNFEIREFKEWQSS